MPTLTEGRAELLRTLAVLAEPPGPEHLRLAGVAGLPEPNPAAWTEAFVVQLVPHAAVYLSADGMLGGEAADRIAGFWRALRLPVPSDADHVTALLGLYAQLSDAERDESVGARRALRRQARGAMLHEHLLSWLMGYTQAMAEVGPAGYAAWARLLREALRDEARAMGLPDRLPAQLRAVPPLVASTLDDLLDGLLSPARSGLVLTRGHLAALARDAGLGLRLGDRRRVLRALLEQDPVRTLRMMTEMARAWAARHRADEAITGPTGRFYQRRARATAELLRTGVTVAGRSTAATG